LRILKLRLEVAVFEVPDETQRKPPISRQAKESGGLAFIFIDQSSKAGVPVARSATADNIET